MKRWLWMVAVFAGAVGIAVHGTTRGQFGGPKPGDVGPGDKGAVLRNPGLDPAPSVPPAPTGLPSYLQKLQPEPAPVVSAPGAVIPMQSGKGKIALPPSNPVHINRDIEITPEAGAFAIFVMAYSGSDAPTLARNLVLELRERYKIPNSYVFNFGAKEKQEEFERVQKIRKEQMDALQKAGLRTDLPIHVPTVRIDEQTGVLIGGFKSYDDAHRGLLMVRKLEPPDPKRVKMDIEKVHREFVDKSGKKVKDDHVHDMAYVSPFMKAFVCRNPTVQFGSSTDTVADEVKYLRRINADEPFSLFNCKKPWTLAIKQYKTAHRTIGDDKEAKGFLSMLTSTRNNGVDHTAHNAHNLAEAMRKGGLPETYVLHCRSCSYVTVGGFMSGNDKEPIAMQNFLENRFTQPAFRQLDLFPRPVPMQVPQ